MIRVTLTGTEAIRAQFARLEQIAQGAALARTAADVERLVEREADKHTKTGALFQSVYSRKITGGYEIGHDLQRAPHALFVHWGTKPHVIRPKDRKVLRWASDGKSYPSSARGDFFIFAREVHHPGYKGDPWLKRAAAEAPRIFARHVENLIRKA